MQCTGYYGHTKLRDKNDRLLTMLINPLMSCSVRLPVYILIAGAIFPRYAGTVIFGLYLAGILLATAGLVFYAGGARGKHLLWTGVAAVPVLLVLMLLSSHAWIRLMAMVNPSRVSPRVHYQLDQSLYALGPGGWIGRGLGKSIRSCSSCPSPTPISSSPSSARSSGCSGRCWSWRFSR
jgi:cell division protein FtsW (lipid II flippase)